MPPERLRRFFTRTDSGYQINRAIREMCVFSRHNVAKDPPLSRMDIISCRNLLIYFVPSLQKRIIATFSYALQPSGHLILGTSETLGSLSDYFVAIDEKHKIYGKKANVTQNLFQMPDIGGEYIPTVPPASPESRLAEPAKPGNQLQGYVNQLVLSRFGPAGMVVNESLRITEYRETYPSISLRPQGSPMRT